MVGEKQDGYARGILSVVAAGDATCVRMIAVVTGLVSSSQP